MFWFAGDLRRMGDLLALRMDGSSPLPEGELGSERIGVREGERGATEATLSRKTLLARS